MERIVGSKREGDGIGGILTGNRIGVRHVESPYSGTGIANEDQMGAVSIVTNMQCQL